jgi:hypothetical protein
VVRTGSRLTSPILACRSSSACSSNSLDPRFTRCIFTRSYTYMRNELPRKKKSLPRLVLVLDDSFLPGLLSRVLPFSFPIRLVYTYITTRLFLSSKWKWNMICHEGSVQAGFMPHWMMYQPEERDISFGLLNEICI